MFTFVYILSCVLVEKGKEAKERGESVHRDGATFVLYEWIYRKSFLTLPRKNS